MRSYKRFHRLGLPDRSVNEAAASAKTYGDFVAHLYSQFAAAHGKRLGGEKTPDYVRYLPWLHGLVPGARTVHIIRDGRDVALSTLDWARVNKGPGRFALWQEEPVAVCALWWARQIGTGRRDGHRLGTSRYQEIQYEDLVQEPEQPVRHLATFLGLRYAEEMLEYHKGKQRDDPGLSAKKAWLPPTAGLRDWRAEMASADVELFEALAGDQLADVGYELVCSSPSAPTAARAERCRARWHDEIGGRDERRRRKVAAETGRHERDGR